MKKASILLFLFVWAGIAMAQSSPVTLQFVRPKSSAGSFSTVKILINNQHIGDIENGSTFTYRLVFSGKGTIELLVNSSIYSKTLSFEAEQGSVYSFETGFADMGVYLLAIDNPAFEKQKQALAVQSSAPAQQQTNVGTSQRELASQVLIDRTNKSVTLQSEKELDSEAIRQQWLQKGGLLTGTSFVGGLSVLYKETDDIWITGAGLNMAFNQTIFNLKIPEYKAGPTSWTSFHFGYGLAGSANSVEIEFPGTGFDAVTSTSYQLDVSMNAGLTIGLGRFIDRTNWRGAAIELNYKPVYSTYIPEEGEAQSNFNFSGFSIDFNGSNFTSTMNKIAPKAQVKFSIFILPPVNDMPFFVSINLGALWYSK